MSFWVEALESRKLLSGTWSYSAAPLPNNDSAAATFLLPDGAVMVHGGGDSTSRLWYRLTPDHAGSYGNGAWSQLASSNVGRLFFGSDVLPNGTVFTTGGEDSDVNGQVNGPATNSSEVYEPATNQWTVVAPQPSLDPAPDFFNGMLDDVAVYPRGLSAAEVASLYSGKSAVTPGPVAQYEFKEGAGITTADLSGNGNTATLYNGASFASASGDPISGGALSLNGVDQFALAPDSPSLDPTSGITLSAWADANNWDGNPRIIQKGSTDNQYRLLAEFGLLKFDLAGVGTVTAPLPSTGMWHLITGTWNGSTMTLYVDGKSVATVAAAGILTTSKDALAIGAKSATDFQYNGGDDDVTGLLPNGEVLVGDTGGPVTRIYTPSTNTWVQGPTKLYGDSNDEETWVTLGDGSILCYDIGSSEMSGIFQAQRYVPSPTGIGSWVDASDTAGNVPLLSSDGELGPGVLMPDGRAFFTGTNGNTAFYDPTTNSWTAGPTLRLDGTLMYAGDSPAAVMPDGNVLLALTPLADMASTHLVDLDPASGILTDVTPVVPAGVKFNMNQANFAFTMLDLPSGQVMVTDDTGQVAFYTPDGVPQPSWQPKITSVVNKGGGNYTLTGTQLNGLDEGSYYGDDLQNATNYPIVQVTDLLGGDILYASTSDWSSTGVATGNKPETVNFTMPSSLGGDPFELRVITNGIASALLASPGTVETSFGVNVQASGSVAEPNGKIIVVGTVAYSSSQHSWAIARYNPDGTLDTTFGDLVPGSSTERTGMTVTDFDGDDVAHSVAIQKDGKIVVAGTDFLNSAHTVAQGLIARYNTNGTLDTTFGTGGTVAINAGFPSGHTEATSVIIDYTGTPATNSNYGKLWVTGGSVGGASAGVLLVRIDADGALDTTFGSNGDQIYDFNGYQYGTALALEPDDSVVISGVFAPGGSNVSNVLLMRAGGNGDLIWDRIGGFTNSSSKPYFSDQYLGLAIQPNGNIVVAGQAWDGSHTDMVVARYNFSDGSLDTSFNPAGTTFSPAGTVTLGLPGIGGSASDVILQPDDKILVAGTGYPSGPSFVVARLDPNGSLDTTFNSNGVVTEESGGPASATYVNVQSNGDIVTEGGNEDFGLIQLNGTNGGLDTTFGQTATTTSLISSGDPISYGQLVKFTATVTPIEGAGEAGTVQFLIDGSPVGFPVSLSDNKATYNTSALGLGFHSVWAIYSGDTGGNFAGSTSVAITQTVINSIVTPPKITTQPASLTVVVGSKAELKVAASGSPAPTAQWQVSGNGGATWVNISGATSLTYSFTASSTQNGHEFRAVLSNYVGTATSAAATLTVDAPPIVTKQPANQSVEQGKPVTFSASASGNPTPTPQWQLSTNGGSTWSNISGAKSTSYTFATLKRDNGYEYRAIFSNSEGTATTGVAKLTVM